MRTCTGRLARCAAWLLVSVVTGCATRVPHESAAAQRLADRDAIEDVLSRANLGFELSDPDAGARSKDAHL